MLMHYIPVSNLSVMSGCFPGCTKGIKVLLLWRSIHICKISLHQVVYVRAPLGNHNKGSFDAHNKLALTQDQHQKSVRYGDIILTLTMEALIMIAADDNS